MKKPILYCLIFVLFVIPVSLGTSLAQDGDDAEPTDTAVETTETTTDDSASGDDDLRLFQVNSENVINARSAPSTTSNVAGVLQPSEAVEVIEAVEGSLVGGNSIWYRILIAGQDAYIHSSLLVPIPALQNQNVLVDLPDSYLPSITVESTGSVTVSPNLVIIQFGFEQVGTDTASVYRATQTAQDNVISVLTSQGVSANDITTTMVTIINEDVLDPTGGITGEFVYRSQALLTVYADDLDAIGSIIDDALSNGANSIQNVTYTLDDFTDVENQALLNGLERSLEHARNIATESLILLGPSVSINISPFRVTGVEDLVNAPQNVVIPSVPNQLIVSVDIRVEYGIRTR